MDIDKQKDNNQDSEKDKEDKTPGLRCRVTCWRAQGLAAFVQLILGGWLGSHETPLGSFCESEGKNKQKIKVKILKNESENYEMWKWKLRKVKGAGQPWDTTQIVLWEWK